MNNRPLIIFLLANFVICLVVIINFRNKAQESSIAAKNEVITQTAVEKASPIVATNTSKPHEQVFLNVPVAPSEPAVCMEYGPLDIEQKAIFDTIISKEKINNLVSVSQKNKYEIYWNLGTNQLQANEMFEKQKKDALQDKKFQMTQEDGHWIVSIAIIDDNMETAKVLANQLSDKANRVNAGGKWYYRTLPAAYFYQIKNINAMTPNSQAQITTGLKVGEKACAA